MCKLCPVLPHSSADAIAMEQVFLEAGQCPRPASYHRVLGSALTAHTHPRLAAGPRSPAMPCLSPVRTLSPLTHSTTHAQGGAKTSTEQHTVYIVKQQVHASALIRHAVNDKRAAVRREDAFRQRRSSLDGYVSQVGMWGRAAAAVAVVQ